MTAEVLPLPPSAVLETTQVLKKLASAHRFLAELKGKFATIPNESILINTLALQEAKDSSAIENIITTHDDLYKSQLFEQFFTASAAKEVGRYARALTAGFEQVRRRKVFSEADLLEVHRILEQNDAGYRRLPGTTLVNEATGETVYTPPQDYETITGLMRNLIDYFNSETSTNGSAEGIDSLVKMAVIHLQFESIHPFYDGNGRTGRILNILYLVLHGLLDLPILYLSRYIIRTKSEYYRLLKTTRETGDWEAWVLYMLDGIEQISMETIVLIERMRVLMQDYKRRIRSDLPKIYSQDLLNNLFRHPYTKIEFLTNELQVSRPTATRYLEALVREGYLQKQKTGGSNFYVNQPLYELFAGQMPVQASGDAVRTVQA